MLYGKALTRQRYSALIVGLPVFAIIAVQKLLLVTLAGRTTSMLDVA
jgi:hypothetical protein